MLSLSATTELSAVNIMLGTIGESPISDLTSDQSMVDVATARAVLREVTIQVQEEGWKFNREINWLLTPDAAGFIFIPTNCLQLDTPSDSSWDVTARGGKLYDRVAHSFVFSAQILVDMITLINFDDMPESARHYITIRSARVFQQRMVGSDTLGQFTEKDEARARSALKKLDANNSRYNFLSGSWSVMRVLAR